MRDEKVNDWIVKAKKQMNAAFDEFQKDESKKRIRITLTRNPQQTVEVEPDTAMEFNAKAI